MWVGCLLLLTDLSRPTVCSFRRGISTNEFDKKRWAGWWQVAIGCNAARYRNGDDWTNMGGGANPTFHFIYIFFFSFCFLPFFIFIFLYLCRVMEIRRQYLLGVSYLLCNATSLPVKFNMNNEKQKKTKKTKKKQKKNHKEKINKMKMK